MCVLLSVVVLVSPQGSLPYLHRLPSLRTAYIGGEYKARTAPPPPPAPCILTLLCSISTLPPPPNLESQCCLTQPTSLGSMHAAATYGRLLHSPALLQHLERLMPSSTNAAAAAAECSSSSTTSGGVGTVRRPTDKVLFGVSNPPASGGVSPRHRRFRRRVLDQGGEEFLVGEYGERILVSSYADDEEEEGPIKLECDDSGCVIVMPNSKSLAEEDDGGGYLRCDLTGCYFSEEPAPEKSFEVIEGEGWRLGYETAPESEESFCAMVGAGGWSLALTASEFNDFCYLIQTLRKGISTMDEDGFIGKDEVVMQVERGCVWMECSIPKKRVAVFQNLWKLGNRALVDSQQKTAFELRFILSGASGRRQAEGFWPAEAVMDMLKKVDATNLELDCLAEEVHKPAAANV